MNSETEPTVLRTPKRPHRRHLNNMPDVLAQMQRSGSTHFVKTLPRTALPHCRVRQSAKLSLPTQFVEENGDKFGEMVTLRVQTSSGRSSKSWPVRVYVAIVTEAATSLVQIIGGWSAFAVDNRLQTGDHLILVLREDARSEFEVHMFRGPNASPYFPDEGERQSDEDEEAEEDDGSSDDSEFEEEEKTNNESGLAAASMHQQAFRRDSIGELNPSPSHHTGNPRVPGFSKRLVASNIGQATGKFKLGQFEFPAHFIRNHGERVHGSVKLQGIHEHSRNYVITCHRRPRNLLKAYFFPKEWSRFVRENDLKEGQVLQFSLMDDSYFLVREISQTCQCGFRIPQILCT